MANETTQTSAFDSTPDSQMYEYKQSIEKVQGVTKQQKENLEKAFETDSVPKFEGKVILPV